MKALVGLVFLGLLACCGCGQNDHISSADEQQQKQQEVLLKEATSRTGMPNITNFRERKQLKMLLELRDRENLATYTYVFSEQTGKFYFFCDSVGYAIPYATEYTNPQQMVWKGYDKSYSVAVMSQADPNGLFAPPDAEGTWVMCKSPDPNSTDVQPVYMEPRIMVSPFKLPQN